MNIKPCPFCGHDDVEVDEISPGRFAITCPECEAIGPASEVSVNAAVLHWNVRQVNAAVPA